jgi:hypothetical protein
MPTWQIEDSVGAHTFQALLERVELILFWKLAEVAGMQDELRRRG